MNSPNAQVFRVFADASFLFLLRHRAVSKPHYALADLAKLDLRLDAMLDTLRVDAPRALASLIDEQPLDDAGDAFVAASLVFECATASLAAWPGGTPPPASAFAKAGMSHLSGQQRGDAFEVPGDHAERIAQVLTSAQDAEPNDAQPSLPDVVDAVASALAWLRPGQQRAILDHLFAIDDEGLVAVASDVAIAATALARPAIPGLRFAPSALLNRCFERTLAGQMPPEGNASIESRRRARALTAIGQLGLTGHAMLVQRHLSSASSRVRGSAAWSACLLQIPGATDALEPFALAELPEETTRDALFAQHFQRPAIEVLLRSLSFEAGLEFFTRASRSERTLRSAVIAAGVLGDSSLIPWLLERCDEPIVARVAGEAISMITGADLAYEDLDGDAPPGFAAGGPNEDETDDRVELDPDEDLPWPDRSRLERWFGTWTASQASSLPRSLAPTTGLRRLLLGKPIAREAQALARDGATGHLRHALRNARQRARYAAAIEVALAAPGTCLANMALRGDWQRAQIETEPAREA